MIETKRLYFEDVGLMEFSARVVERRTVEGRPAVILDQTAFYPESGGQPWDLGTIAGVPVVRIVEEDGMILHVLGREIEGEAVAGRVDGLRRFDHMQQHSGQHILSQAFIEILNGETRSFHLGAETSSLEIGIGTISDESLDRVEARANEVVFKNRPIKTYVVPSERISEVPLRRPPKVVGLIRVVEVEGFDHSACGGTHVRRTGEIGLIKIIGMERIRGNIRFTFVCGGRALIDDQVKTRVCRELVGRFNVPDREIPAAVERLGGELKEAKKRLKTLEQTAAGFEARDLAATAEGKIIGRVFDDKSPDGIRALALNLVRMGEFAVVFGARGETKAHLILARSEALPIDLRPLVATLAPLFQGKGGGGPSLVEIAGDKTADLAAIMAQACASIRERMPS